MNKPISLHVFAEAPQPGAAPAAQLPAAAPAVPPVGGYSIAQAEEIATARAEKAERAALASFFKQQGMDEVGVTEAIKAYKAAQKAKEPDVAAITRERDEYKAQLEAVKQAGELSKKGVKPEFADYVAFQARVLMASDKTLDFGKAADKYLKDNPQYGERKQAYKVQTAIQSGSATGAAPVTAADKEAAARAEINALIRALATGR